MEEIRTYINSLDCLSNPFKVELIDRYERLSRTATHVSLEAVKEDIKLLLEERL